jgi:hypothetical protein
MNKFSHVVLTRFNVRTEFSKGGVPDETWLKHRFELFERYAYPSLRAQTVDNFTWLVFFDAATPQAFRQKIDRYAQWPKFVPCYVESLAIGTPATTARLRHFIQPYCTPDSTHLITTRFDNDDAIGKYYLAKIQQQFAGQSFQFVNFTNGYMFARGKLYKRWYPSNPFISLIEEIDGFRTVWLSGHHKLAEVGEIMQVSDSPQWLQVVHQHNIYNRVRVRNLRVPLRLVQREFCFELDSSLVDESQWVIDLENRLKGFRLRNRRRALNFQNAIKNIWTRGK